MIVSNIAVNSGTPENITIGRRGTYNIQEVTFDLSYLLDNYGDGTAVLMVKRSQDDTAYPAVTTQEEAKLTWVISDADTAYKGNGECELFWYVDGGLAKSVIYPLTVMRDIGETTEEPPDTYQTWVDHLTELGEETLENAQNAAQSATNAKESETNAANSATEAKEAAEMLTDVSATAKTLEPGSEATAKYNNGVFEFGIPKGEKGDKLTYADLTGADKADLVQGPIKEAQDDAVEDVESAESTALQSINTAGTAAVNAVNQAGETQTARVNTAGQTQTNAVNQAGTTQVNAVNTAGETQVAAVEDKGTEVLDSIPDDYTELSNKVNDPITGLDTKAPVIINTASGDIASLADGADSMPIKSLIANIEPVQDLHGYDSPWPAGGGKNLLDFRTKAAGSDAGVTYTNNDGVITVNGTSTGYSWYQSPSFTLPAGTYLVNGRPSGAVSFLYVYNISTSQSIVNVQPGQDFTMTLSEATTVAARVIVSQGNTANNEVFKPMIRLASETDPTFAPYENICPISGWTGMNLYHAPEYDAEAKPTLSVTWQDEAGTVYGGTLDVVSGKLTVESLSVVFDGSSDETWNKYTSGVGGFYISEFFDHAVETYGNGYCDQFPTSKSVSVPGVIYGINSRYIFFMGVFDLVGDTVAAWRSWLAENPVQVVFKRATPLVYHLTPQQIDTLLGSNNIWADTGDVSVEYPADTKLYIQQLTQPEEDDMTANANIEANKFFMIGNALYYSTAAIAAGATIIPGTNCNAVSLADALNTLNA